MKKNNKKPDGWLDEKEFYDKVTQELSNGVMIDEFSKEILSEKDAIKALSKVVFSLIYLVQDEASDSVKGYVDFILSEFKLLSDQFDKEQKFQFFDNKENGAMLRFSNNKNFQLLMRNEFFEKPFSELKNRLEGMK